MISESLKKHFFDIIYKYTLMTALIISISACCNFNALSVMLSGIIGAVVFRTEDKRSLLCILTGFLIILYAVGTIGSSAVIALTAAGLLSFILGKTKLNERINKSKAFMPAVMLGVSLTCTVLVTTDYFGIGATGTTVTEMIKSYVSLGFHPNWRGILYGTIVMVVMITFPRKFKKAAKIVSPLFVAVLGTYLLNLYLIPEGTVSPIRLLGKTDIALTSLKSALPDFTFSGKNILVIILTSVALALVYICFGEKNTENKYDIAQSSSQIIIPAVCGYIIPGKINKKASEYLCGFISAVLISLTFLLTDAFARLPVSSCAVVLIVGAWQCVEPSHIKDSFRSVKSAVIFIASVVITLLTNISAGIIVSVILALSESIGSENENKKA